MEERIQNIGRRIKIMRITKRLPQNEVARNIGISQAHLCNIESGHSTITLDKLLKLHDVLHCPMKDFFVDIDGDGTEEKAQRTDDRFSLQELTAALMLMKR